MMEPTLKLLLVMLAVAGSIGTCIAQGMGSASTGKQTRKSSGVTTSAAHAA